MNQIEKATQFAELHVKGSPLVLFNIWDAGGADAITKAGAKAVATGSWSVAMAHGYPDGEAIPLDLVEMIAGRICASTPLPITIDFEGGYAVEPNQVGHNVQRLIRAGAVGINFEDQVVNGDGLHEISAQCRRIKAIRDSADALEMPLFINARTDLFLKAKSGNDHAELMDSAKQRADAYAEAGASGLFVPGLVDEKLIAEICEHTSLPVNIMMKDGAPSIKQLAPLGVARVSFGPLPYIQSMNTLAEQAASFF